MITCIHRYRIGNLSALWSYYISTIPWARYDRFSNV